MSRIGVAAVATILIAIGGVSMAQDKPSISISSHNQSGGITAYQVNIGRVDLTFDAGVAAEIERKLPKDRPIRLTSVGSQRDQAVANEYANYLEQKGYMVSHRTEVGMMAPPPDSPISITVAPDHSALLISPRS
jgi:hypothetical protein